MPSYRPGANSVRASKAEDSKCKVYGGSGHGALREWQEGCCGRSIRREQHLGGEVRGQQWADLAGPVTLRSYGDLGPQILYCSQVSVLGSHLKGRLFVSLAFPCLFAIG